MSFLGIAAPAVVGAISGFIGQKSQNKASAQANAQMLAWERERATHAHQWEVEDLRKAGLNPILSAGGSGANTSCVSIIPSGTSPFSAGINSALSTQTAISTIKGIEHNNDKTEAEADIQDFLRQAYRLASHGNHFYPDPMNPGGYIVDGDFNFIADKIKQEAITSAKQNELLEKEIESLDADIAKKEAFAEMYRSDAGKWIALAETLIPLAGSIFSPLAYIGGNAVKKPSHTTIRAPHKEIGTVRHVNVTNYGKD